MRKTDIVIGLFILAILAGIIFWIRKPEKDLQVPEDMTTVEEEMENFFNIEIPEDAEKAQLKDVAGGDSSGIATRDQENGTFVHVVLADLPDPEGTDFYEGWLVRGKVGDDNFDFISTGKMIIAKGGYLLDFESRDDLSEYMGVVITLEEVADANPETHVLEGSF